MIRPIFALLAPALLASGAAAQAPGFHLLKPFTPAPGKTVSIRTESKSENGEIIVTKGSIISKGTLSTTSSETLERTVSGSGKTAKLQYRTLADLRTTSTRIGETESTETLSGPLLGKTVHGMRGDDGKWRLYLDGASNDPLVAAAISKLEAYENRRLFIELPVRVGQSWPIDPGFIRHLIERDLGKSPIKATMTLTGIETIDAEPTAVLTYAIESAGAKQSGDTKRQAAASVSLTGTMLVSLNTMLDKKTTLKGSLTSMATNNDTSTTVTLPVNMTATKSIR